MVGPRLVTVSLLLRGKDLDPKIASVAMGVEASDSQARGETRTRRSRVYTARNGYWRLEADQNSQDLAEQLESLTSRLSVTGSNILAVPGVEEAFVDVYIGVRNDEFGILSFSFEISTRHAQALAKLGLPLQFTIDSGPPDNANPVTTVDPDPGN